MSGITQVYLHYNPGASRVGNGDFEGDERLTIEDQYKK